MAQVTWTEQALDDLDAICLFIARDAPGYAALFAQAVFRATERLVEFPFSGRVVPEIERQDTREIIVQSYRIIYRVMDEMVQIITVHHGSRPVGHFDPPGIS